MLAEWNIPMTDDRLRSMNTVRWVLAHQQQIDKERRMLKTWARFFGNDMNMYDKDEKGNSRWDEETPRVIPLSAILNPEAFTHLTDRSETTTFEEQIPSDVYEEQIKKLEESGFLTDIDIASNIAEEKVKIKKRGFVKE